MYSNQNPDPTICLICMESLMSNKQIVQYVPCLHIAHTSCTLSWFKFGITEEICPYCKLDVFELKIVKDGTYHLPAECQY